MSKVVVDVLLLEEEDFEKQVAASNGQAENHPMSPQAIVDKLVQMDPDDLDDVQQRLYDACWGENGVLIGNVNEDEIDG